MTKFNKAEVKDLHYKLIFIHVGMKTSSTLNSELVLFLGNNKKKFI